MANSPFKAAYNQLQTASEKVKQESARSPATTGRATKTTKANTQLETPTKRRYAGHDIDDDEDLVAVDDEEEEVEGAEFEDDEVEQQELDDEEGEGEEDDEEEVQDEDVEEEEVEEEEVAQITSAQDKKATKIALAKALRNFKNARSDVVDGGKADVNNIVKESFARPVVDRSPGKILSNLKATMPAVRAAPKFKSVATDRKPASAQNKKPGTPGKSTKDTGKKTGTQGKKGAGPNPAKKPRVTK